MESRNGKIYIADITIEDVLNAVEKFPHRYHMHRCSNIPGRWKCLILQNEKYDITLQLVDVEFEPHRGSVPYDAPVFQLSFEDTHRGTLLKYSFKWLRWKAVLMTVIALGIAVYNLNFVVALLGENQEREILMLLIGCFFAALFLYWLVQNIKHDFTTIRAFKQIIKKNFPQCVEIR